MTKALQIIDLLSLEERRQVYYHGTSSIFLREILKIGFVPNPKKKVWDSTKGSLESYYGTYFTDNFMTAYGAAGNASRKLGGNPVIFEVQLETRTGLADEDEIGSVYGSLAKAMQISRIPVDYAKSIVSSFDSSQEAGNNWYAPKSFEKDVVDLTLDLWIEDFDKRMGGIPKLEMTVKDIKKLKPFFSDYLKELLKAIIVHGSDSLDPETMNKTTPELRKAKSDFIKALGAKPLGRFDGGTRYNNIRVPQPVTFKGKNKILSAIEILYKAETVTPEDGKPYGVTHLIARYGKVSPEFEKLYGQRIGGEFKII